MEFQLGFRNVIWGLEGCGKSSSLFESLAKKDQTILFGFKNYALMLEQMYNWSSRFSIPLDRFAIAGNNTTYETALNAYTNKDFPYVINKNVKFIFTSQAQIQRLGHKEFIYETGETVKYDHIVIDEFDYSIGIIPSLHYQMENLNEDIEEFTSKKLQSWLRKNYSKIDVYRAKQFDSFNLAFWLEDTSCPITFLTSETLAAEFLELLGFERFEKESSQKNFKDCIVHTWANKAVSPKFLEYLGNSSIWHMFFKDFDAVISDKLSFTSLDNIEENTLSIKTISHTAARGRNDLIGKNIVTILSYIPSKAIKRITAYFNYFSEQKKYSFKEIESAFYRDRLCQAIGRVIGNRGLKETYLIAHSSLIQNLPNFPYTLDKNWKLDVSNLDETLVKVQKEKTYKNKKRKKDYSFLDSIFKKEEGSILKASEIKNKLKEIGETCTAAKVARYFNAENKNVRTKAGVFSSVIGVAFK